MADLHGSSARDWCRAGQDGFSPPSVIWARAPRWPLTAALVVRADVLRPIVTVTPPALLHTVGAALFASGRPRLNPAWFGYHEAWHTSSSRPARSCSRATTSSCAAPNSA